MIFPKPASMKTLRFAFALAIVPAVMAARNAPLADCYYVAKPQQVSHDSAHEQDQSNTRTVIVEEAGIIIVIGTLFHDLSVAGERRHLFPSAWRSREHAGPRAGVPWGPLAYPDQGVGVSKNEGLAPLVWHR